LFVCDSMRAVISIACPWCMIIPCMNFTSASEIGGSCALVEGGRVRLGWPGAPGCITTGCCARTGNEKKQGIIAAAKSTLRDNSTPLTRRSLRLHSELNDFMYVER
jgi:hypothetical protein